MVDVSGLAMVSCAVRPFKFSCVKVYKCFLSVTGERSFPPTSGLTYSSWLCIDKFSCSDVDGHPVRLLTIARHVQAREDSLVCLAMFLSARDRALFISTSETPFSQAGESIVQRITFVLLP